MLEILAINGYYINNLSINIGKLPKFEIRLGFKADNELSRSIISFVFNVLLVSLCFCLYLVFY